jgi:hypothetical protein
MPFWAWDLDPTVPPCAFLPQVEVDMPWGQGTKKTRMPSPFYKFRFPEAATAGKFGALGFSGRETFKCDAATMNSFLEAQGVGRQGMRDKMVGLRCARVSLFCLLIYAVSIPSLPK